MPPTPTRFERFAAALVGSIAQPAERKIIRVLLLVGVLALVGVRLLSDQSAAQLATAAATGSEAEALAVVPQLVRYDSRAAAALALLAADSRANVARAARRGIDDLLDRWSQQQHLNPATFDAAARAETLATALANNAAAIGPANGVWLERCVAQLLDLAQPAAPQAKLAVVLACDRVLADSRSAAPAVQGHRTGGTWPTQAAVASPALDVAAAPAPTPQPPIAAPLTQTTPPPLATQPAPAPAPVSEVPPPAPSAPAVEWTPPAAALTTIPEPVRTPTVTTRPAVMVESDATPEPRTVSEPKLDALPLLAEVAGYRDDPRGAMFAAWMLREAGFGAIAPEYAELAISDRPEQRVELVTLVTRDPNLVAAPWLMMLARDDEAGEVRAAALAALAASGDAKLLEQVRELALQDPDPRVAAAVSSVIQR